MNKVLKNLEKRGFEIRRSHQAFEVVNPSDRETGMVVLDPADGYMSWQRMEWSHWGPFENLDDDQGAQLVADKIVRILAATHHPSASSSQ